MKSVETVKSLLKELNQVYVDAHVAYEQAFWKSYMGDKTDDEAFVRHKKRLDAVRESVDYCKRVEGSIEDLEGVVAEGLGEDDKKEVEALIERLEAWKKFFRLYKTPKEVEELKSRIHTLEKDIESAKTNRKYGYTDPDTGKFVKISDRGMLMRMRTDSDEAVRKACWEGIEKTIDADIDKYVELVTMRNEYARALGYPHFYEYKAQIEENMSAESIWKIFEDLRKQAQPAYDHVREMEKTQPGLREPWNYGYMIFGDFTTREDEYLPLSHSIERWVNSMTACGVTYRGATLTLDLLERKGKYNNGFCHMENPVCYPDGKADINDSSRQPGKINFTCTAIPGQVGDGDTTTATLFHEGGHAAHFAHMDCEEVILNTEYPPASTAWAETQSMFLDTMYSSIEWKMRYAKNAQGELYPWELYKEKIEKTQPLALKGLMGIAAMVGFERLVYQENDLTAAKVKQFAKTISDRYFDYTTPFHFVLLPVHLYARESACAYHGYGLASLAVAQRRKYRYEKDGYIVDNPNIGPAMQRGRAHGSSRTFQELLRLVTGDELSIDPYVEQASLTATEKLKQSRTRLATTEKQTAKQIEKQANKPASTHDSLDSKNPLDAHIRIVHGDTTIADSNEGGLTSMAEKFKEFVEGW